MNARAALAVLAAAIVLAGCQKVSSDPVERGRVTFNAYGCVKCHAIGDNGGTYGPNLTFIGFRKSSAWLDQWLKNPHQWRPQTVMPNFHLNDETRADLVAYLSSEKGQAWDSVGRPWNQPGVKEGDQVKRGELLFNKAGCVACHSKGGEGGYPNNNVAGGQIPKLTTVYETYTKPELMNKIRGGVISTPVDPSAPAPLIFMPKWGDKLSDDEISAVVSYLMSFKPAGGAPSKDDF